MRAWPRTLLFRAFLLISVLIALALVATVLIFRHAVQEPRALQMAQLVVSAVNLTRAGVLSSAPEWRPALLAELRDAEGMRVQLAEPDDVLEPLPGAPRELAQMMAVVRARLGPETRFAGWRNGEEGLWVSFHIGVDEFWLALPLERVEHHLPQVLLLWGSLAVLLSLLGGFLIARQVTQPLRRLAAAARQVGSGGEPEALPEDGAREVAEVAHAFNQMADDLAEYERQRALVLAGISHDLRTPLARVRLAAEIVSETSLREGLAEDVAQMDAVIAQFLDYARLDEGEATEVLAPDAVLQALLRRYGGQAVALEASPEALPDVRIRPLLLQRALSNLVDNALKYGGGAVQLGARRLLDGIEFSVSDRGPGIPEADRERAKRPFERLQAARSDAGGAGLGLAIVERAARLHGGRFELQENPGGGVRASLVLPPV